MSLTKVTLYVVCTAAICAVDGDAAAQCSRDDVRYYLKKCFTREQVTAICSEDSPPDNRRRGRPARDYEAYDDALERETRSDVRRREHEKDVAFLQSAVSAWDVEVTPRHLSYTRKLCLSAGGSPEVSARVKVCPEVRYRVYFAGLKMQGYQREHVLLGTREIEVVGRVKRKLMHNFDEYPPEIRAQLRSTYRARTRAGGTVIPIRKDYPMQRVYQILRAHSNRATRAASAREGEKRTP